MRLKINIILLLALLAVSTSSIIARYLPDVSSFVIAFWRMTIASCLIWLYTFFNKQDAIEQKQYKYYLLSGLFLALHFSSFYGAVKLTSIANATLLGITAPMFTIIYEKLYLRKKLNPVVFIGFVLAGTGTLIITGSGLFNNDNSLIGKFLGLLAAFFISLVYIFASKLRERTGTIAYTRLLYSFAAFFLFIICLSTNNNILDFSFDDFKWLFALGVVPTILGHSLFYYSIKFTSPTVVASVPIGEPIIASFFAWILFSETISMITLLGGLLILIGIYYLVTRSPTNSKIES
jgi:drug/metabolite transporter (DMT)-like permease